MADNKKKDEQEAEQAAGRTEVGETTASEQGGANQLAEDSRGRVFGDTTSSSAGANQPGYHGRDGGVAEGTTNNPTAQEEETDETEPEQGALKTL